MSNYSRLLSNCYYGFSSDKIDIFFFLIDKSGSMDDDEDNVVKGLKEYQKSFRNFPEANSIAVSISKFNGSFYPEPFLPISEFDTSYYANGLTALNYSIVKGAEYLEEYVREVTARTNITPRVTFICFSDGCPEGDSMSPSAGMQTIEKLNYAGVTTVFVAFGRAITSDFGKNMGFQSTIDVVNREALVNFLGVELSKSCKEQSKSLKALGENFFSQAVDKSKSQGYSQTTAQVLEDNSWINDI